MFKSYIILYFKFILFINVGVTTRIKSKEKQALKKTRVKYERDKTIKTH